MSQESVQRDHLRKITQTTAKGRVSNSGRFINIPRNPKDMARINDKARISNKANEEDKLRVGNKTGGNETKTHCSSKTKNGTGHAKTPGEVGDAATPEDGVATRKRGIEPLKDNKTGLACSPIGKTGRATSPGTVLAATGAVQHKQHNPLCP